MWGHEHLPLLQFLEKIRLAGYDGIETWLPDNPADQTLLFDYLQKHEMSLVIHQHEAEGATFSDFKASFVANLHRCAAPNPILINSHTGRDYFTTPQNLELIAAANDFTAKTGIRVAHETHRGRLGYSPQSTMELFEVYPEMSITADFSHWTCVTESLLDNFSLPLEEAIKRTIHIHARVGFEEGPQIPDPRAPEWSYAVNRFLHWWDRIVAHHAASGTSILPITTEFGPEPYMPKAPYSQTPMVDQFEVNVYMKNLLVERFSAFR